jgi:hypothetical protein
VHACMHAFIYSFILNASWHESNPPRCFEVHDMRQDAACWQIMQEPALASPPRLKPCSTTPARLVAHKLASGIQSCASQPCDYKGEQVTCMFSVEMML